MSKKFVRQEAVRYSKLGKNRKKLQKWRKPKGRDSKMRLKRKSYSASPTVGHRSPKKESGKIKDLFPVLVYNVKDLLKVNKNSIAIIAKVGAKNRLEIIKEAEKNKIKILNVKGDKK